MKVNAMNETIVFYSGSDIVVKAVTAVLTRRRFCVIRSFDLRSALTAHGGCECPHHGTDQCDCQFVVLLVYGEATEPVAITMHSRDNRTEARIVHDAMTIPDPRLAKAVIATLVEAAITLPAAPAPNTEVTANVG
jgi:hypothetical protein